MKEYVKAKVSTVIPKIVFNSIVVHEMKERIFSDYIALLVLRERCSIQLSAPVITHTRRLPVKEVIIRMLNRANTLNINPVNLILMINNNSLVNNLVKSNPMGNNRDKSNLTVSNQAKNNLTVNSLAKNNPMDSNQANNRLVSSHMDNNQTTTTLHLWDPQPRVMKVITPKT